jgi:HrpA-like RNA helicase
LKEALTILLKLGGLDEKDGKINELGKKLARFPLDPPLAKVTK